MRVIVLGATSAIAAATARLYATEGADLLLVGRRPDRLEAMAADLRARGANRVDVAIRDLANAAEVAGDFDRYVTQLGGVDHVVLAYGILGNQGRAERDWAEADAILQSNFTSAAAWMLTAANVLERRNQGSLVVLGSVAGDRGRRTNFVYGAAKAGLATLAEGLAHRFAGRPVRVILVKPGQTVTPMTDGFDRMGPLWATAEQVAACVRRAADRGGPIVYAPWRWWGIMMVIRHLPTFVFNRMNI